MRHDPPLSHRSARPGFTLPRAFRKSKPLYSKPQCLQYYGRTRDAALRYLSHASYMSGTQFLLMLVSPSTGDADDKERKGEAKVEAYGSEALQGLVFETFGAGVRKRAVEASKRFGEVRRREGELEGRLEREVDKMRKREEHQRRDNEAKGVITAEKDKHAGTTEAGEGTILQEEVQSERLVGGNVEEDEDDMLALLGWDGEEEGEDEPSALDPTSITSIPPQQSAFGPPAYSPQQHTPCDPRSNPSDQTHILPVNLAVQTPLNESAASETPKKENDMDEKEEEEEEERDALLLLGWTGDEEETVEQDLTLQEQVNSPDPDIGSDGLRPALAERLDASNGADRPGPLPSASSPRAARVTEHDEQVEPDPSPEAAAVRRLAKGKGRAHPLRPYPAGLPASLLIASSSTSSLNLDAYYQSRLSLLGPSTTKQILRLWIHEVVDPSKSRRQNGKAAEAEEVMPEWWPDPLPYKDTDKMLKEERATLAIHLLRYPKIDISQLEVVTALNSVYLQPEKLVQLRQLYRVAKQERRSLTSKNGGLAGSAEVNLDELLVFEGEVWDEERSVIEGIEERRWRLVEENRGKVNERNERNGAVAQRDDVDEEMVMGGWEGGKEEAEGEGNLAFLLGDEGEEAEDRGTMYVDAAEEEPPLLGGWTGEDEEEAPNAHELHIDPQLAALAADPPHPPSFLPQNGNTDPSFPSLSPSHPIFAPTTTYAYPPQDQPAYKYPPSDRPSYRFPPPAVFKPLHIEGGSDLEEDEVPGQPLDLHDPLPNPYAHHLPFANHHDFDAPINNNDDDASSLTSSAPALHQRRLSDADSLFSSFSTDEEERSCGCSNAVKLKRLRKIVAKRSKGKYRPVDTFDFADPRTKRYIYAPALSKSKPPPHELVLLTKEEMHRRKKRREVVGLGETRKGLEFYATFWGEMEVRKQEKLATTRRESRRARENMLKETKNLLERTKKQFAEEDDEEEDEDEDAEGRGGRRMVDLRSVTPSPRRKNRAIIKRMLQQELEEARDRAVGADEDVPMFSLDGALSEEDEMEDVLPDAGTKFVAPIDISTLIDPPPEDRPRPRPSHFSTLQHRRSPAPNHISPFLSPDAGPSHGHDLYPSNWDDLPSQEQSPVASSPPLDPTAFASSRPRRPSSPPRSSPPLNPFARTQPQHAYQRRTDHYEYHDNDPDPDPIDNFSPSPPLRAIGPDGRSQSFFVASSTSPAHPRLTSVALVPPRKTYPSKMPALAFDLQPIVPSLGQTKKRRRPSQPRRPSDQGGGKRIKNAQPGRDEVAWAELKEEAQKRAHELLGREWETAGRDGFDDGEDAGADMTDGGGQEEDLRAEEEERRRRREGTRLELEERERKRRLDLQASSSSSSTAFAKAARLEIDPSTVPPPKHLSDAIGAYLTVPRASPAPLSAESRPKPIPCDRHSVLPKSITILSSDEEDLSASDSDDSGVIVSGRGLGTGEREREAETAAAQARRLAKGKFRAVAGEADEAEDAAEEDGSGGEQVETREVSIGDREVEEMVAEERRDGDGHAEGEDVVTAVGGGGENAEIAEEDDPTGRWNEEHPGQYTNEVSTAPLASPPRVSKAALDLPSSLSSTPPAASFANDEDEDVLIWTPKKQPPLPPQITTTSPKTTRVAGGGAAEKRKTPKKKSWAEEMAEEEANDPNFFDFGSDSSDVSEVFQEDDDGEEEEEEDVRPDIRDRPKSPPVAVPPPPASGSASLLPSQAQARPPVSVYPSNAASRLSLPAPPFRPVQRASFSSSFSSSSSRPTAFLPPPSPHYIHPPNPFPKPKPSILPSSSTPTATPAGPSTSALTAISLSPSPPHNPRAQPEAQAKPRAKPRPRTGKTSRYKGGDGSGKEIKTDFDSMIDAVAAGNLDELLKKVNVRKKWG